jgi:hypothetical protein
MAFGLRMNGSRILADFSDKRLARGDQEGGTTARNSVIDAFSITRTIYYAKSVRIFEQVNRTVVRSQLSMKKLATLVIMAGALSQMANAMGPMGDLTHRRFYKKQEWIWQTAQSQSIDANVKSKNAQSASVHIWELPVASTLPVRPPLASTLPVRPPLASTLPVRPPLASTLPVRPPLASTLPVRPPLASTLPVRPPLASTLPVRPPLASTLPVRPPLASTLPVRPPST